MLTDEYRYRILKLLDANPQASQRGIARELGISLGKVNYCLKALIERGWVRANNFRHNEQKRAYWYLLAPKGIEAKAKVTIGFLKRNLGECESLKRELAELPLDAVLMHHHLVLCHVEGDIRHVQNVIREILFMEWSIHTTNGKRPVGCMLSASNPAISP